MSSEIISALLEWNPWLESTFPGTLLGIAREYDITRYIAIPEIKILEGVRRSGKSTLLYQNERPCNLSGDSFSQEL